MEKGTAALTPQEVALRLWDDVEAHLAPHGFKRNFIERRRRASRAVCYEETFELSKAVPCGIWKRITVGVEEKADAVAGGDIDVFVRLEAIQKVSGSSAPDFTATVDRVVTYHRMNATRIFSGPFLALLKSNLDMAIGAHPLKGCRQ